MTKFRTVGAIAALLLPGIALAADPAPSPPPPVNSNAPDADRTSPDITKRELSREQVAPIGPGGVSPPLQVGPATQVPDSPSTPPGVLAPATGATRR